jgi:hypothetical protein
MNKKDNMLVKIGILAGLLILSFLLFYRFMNIRVTRYSMELSSILSESSFFIFILFSCLFLLKFKFPSIINNRYVNNKNIKNYILATAIILALIIPLIMFKSFNIIFRGSTIISFIYLYGIVTICTKIFFNM